MFLVLRNRTYHFRFKVPVKLVSVIGRNEIKASLLSGSKRTAQPLALSLANSCRSIFMRLELTPETLLMKLDSKTLNRILRDEIRQTVAHYVNGHVTTGSALQDTLDGLDLMIDNAKGKASVIAQSLNIR